MSEYGTITEAGSIRFERLLPARIERVWAYLTDSELRGKWLATGPMELQSGGQVTFRFRNSDLSLEHEETPEPYRQYEGTSMKGHIVRVEPPRLLVHSWNEPSEDIEGSEVTFELEERGDETLLVLTHRRLPNRATLVGVAGGWHTHLNVLRHVLAGARPQPFWSAHEAFAAEYENRIP